jgi:hypothetical protein
MRSLKLTPFRFLDVSGLASPSFSGVSAKKDWHPILLKTIESSASRQSRVKLKHYERKE